MSLYNLLKNIITKLNKTISTDAQTLSAEQKAQARKNIDADPLVVNIDDTANPAVASHNAVEIYQVYLAKRPVFLRYIDIELSLITSNVNTAIFSALSSDSSDNTTFYYVKIDANGLIEEKTVKMIDYVAEELDLENTINSINSKIQTINNTKANKTDVNNSLNNKVDKESGKGLSTNDFTDLEKSNLDLLIQREKHKALVGDTKFDVLSAEYDYFTTLTDQTMSKDLDPSFSIKDLIGAKVVYNNSMFSYLLQNPITTISLSDFLTEDEELGNLGTSFFSIKYSTFGVLNNPVFAITGPFLMALAPSLFKDDEKWEGLIYVEQYTQDELGLGMQFKPGWYLINLTNQTAWPVNIEDHSILMPIGLFKNNQIAEILLGLGFVKNINSYIISKENILQMDSQTYIVSLAPLPPSNLQRLIENADDPTFILYGLYTIFSFIIEFSEDNCTINWLIGYSEETRDIYLPKKKSHIKEEFLPMLKNIDNYIFPETIIEVIDDGTEYNWFDFDIGFEFQLGKNYTIIFDGEEYFCSSYYHADPADAVPWEGVYIATQKVGYFYYPIEVPFIASTFYGSTTMRFLCSLPGQHTISIRAEEPKYIIDQEYIEIYVPAWTEEDEGSVLQIVNGKPTWVKASGANAMQPISEEEILEILN